jgi:hypothetical protein
MLYYKMKLFDQCIFLSDSCPLTLLNLEKTKFCIRKSVLSFMGEIMLIMDLNKTYVKDKQYL